jgi:hypothetical protein
MLTIRDNSEYIDVITVCVLPLLYEIRFNSTQAICIYNMYT